MRRVWIVYSGLCLALLLLALGSRAVYYGAGSLPAPLDHAVGALLRFYLVTFPVLMGTLPIQMALLAVLGTLFLFWRRPFWSGDRGSRRLRPWVYAAASTLFVLNHYQFDADPLLAPLCWGTLALLALGLSGRPRRVPERWRYPGLAALCALAALATLAVAPTPVIRIAVLAWVTCLVLVGWLSRSRRRAPEFLLLALGFMPVCTFLIPAALVLAVPGLRGVPGMVLEDRGYAYGYCENPERHQLFMTVPVGQTADLQGLRHGYIAEYDTRNLSRRKEHRLFDEEFYGGLRMIVCLGDVVQVSMNGVYLHGDVTTSNVLEFRSDDPSQVRPSIFGDSLRRLRGWDLLGHALAYDSKRDAMYYVSEWTNTMFRLDRSTGQLDPLAGHILPRKDLALGVNNGPQTSPGAVHRGRDTLYLAEWGDGSRIYEINLATGNIGRTFDTHDTGTFGLGLDEKGDRLFASGLWGVNVIDLKDGRVLRRFRTGPGARGAIVDTRRDLVYIPTTFGGHAWVLDRDSLRTLGRLSTGIGGRPAYLSLDGRLFFASDQNHVYVWSAEALAYRFRN